MAEKTTKKTSAKTALAKKAPAKNATALKLEWTGGKVCVKDPAKAVLGAGEAECASVDELVSVLGQMKSPDPVSVRIAGAMGVVLAANSIDTLNENKYYKAFTANTRALIKDREGDVDLIWGVNRMMAVAASMRNRGIETVKKTLIDEIPATIAESPKVGVASEEKAPVAKSGAKKAETKGERKGPNIPPTIEWADGTVRLIDQSKLPLVGEIVEVKTLDELIFAIAQMKVRGAPALGIAGAMGVVLAANSIGTLNETEFYRKLNEEVRRLIVTRPTAANLIWGINKMMAVAAKNKKRGIATVRKVMAKEIPKMIAEDVKRNRKMADLGVKLVEDKDRILTHCNAGALATAGYGTALGVIFAAFEDGKDIKVYVDETRPCLQGARLTTWELMQAGVPMVLIADGASGLLMREGEITKVFVGADRIAANGDVANKIGTYPISVVAKENKIPFYVVAPTSTVDLGTPQGRKIPIELRGPEEITMVGETQIAPDGVQVYNPAFDIVPAENVTAIITEKGVAKPPYDESLAKLMRKK